MKTALSLLCFSGCLATNAALADDALPKESDWQLIMTLKYPAAASVYSGPDAKARIQPGFLVWFKVVYDKPQDGKAGPYQTEIVRVKAHCGATSDENVFAVIRDLKYTKDGKLVADDVTDEKGAKLKPARHYKSGDTHSKFTVYDGLGLDAFDGGCGP